jgi:hypothetical protein
MFCAYTVEKCYAARQRAQPCTVDLFASVTPPRPAQPQSAVCGLAVLRTGAAHAHSHRQTTLNGAEAHTQHAGADGSGRHRTDTPVSTSYSTYPPADPLQSVQSNRMPLVNGQVETRAMCIAQAARQPASLCVSSHTRERDHIRLCSPHPHGGTSPAPCRPAAPAHTSSPQRLTTSTAACCIQVESSVAQMCGPHQLHCAQISVVATAPQHRPHALYQLLHYTCIISLWLHYPRL